MHSSYMAAGRRVALVGLLHFEFGFNPFFGRFKFHLKLFDEHLKRKAGLVLVLLDEGQVSRRRTFTLSKSDSEGNSKEFRKEFRSLGQ